MNKPPRRFKRMILLILMLALIGGGVYVYRQHQQEKKASAQISVAEITRGDIEDVVTAQGKLEPKTYVDVGAQVTGQLKLLAVELGQVVKKGDLIAEIDPQIYSTQVAADEARLKTLKAQYAEQQAQLKLATLIQNRNAKLIKEKAVSQQVYEESMTSQKVAQAKLQSLEAQIEESASTLEGNKAKLNFTQIYAPMDGTVTVQTARQGETLNANQTTPTIVQLADLDIMTVRAQVAEADITKITVGMPVYFTTLGAKSRRWEATVRQILPTPETINDVVLYNVLVDVSNEDRQLMSNMSTQMFFVLGNASDVTLIPVTALGKRMNEQDGEKGQAYQVRVQNGKAIKEKTIFIGMMTRNQAEVKEGLQPGDKVVLATPSSEKAGATPRRMSPRI